MSTSTLNLPTPESPEYEFDRQLNTGVTPDTLVDLGYSGPTPSVDPLTVQSRITPLPGEQLDLSYEAQVQAEEKELRDRADSIEAREKQREIDLTARKNYLTAVSESVARAVKLRGFQTNTQRTPRNRGGVEKAQKGSLDKASFNLGLACGKCALSDTCKIVGNIDLWVETHPYQSSDGRLHGSKVARTESRDKFLKRLKTDPSADCVPPKPKKP